MGHFLQTLPLRPAARYPAESVAETPPSPRLPGHDSLHDVGQELHHPAEPAGQRVVFAVLAESAVGAPQLHGPRARLHGQVRAILTGQLDPAVRQLGTDGPRQSRHAGCQVQADVRGSC